MLSVGLSACATLHDGEDSAAAEAEVGPECAPITTAFRAGETDGLTNTDAQSGLQVRVVAADHVPLAKGFNTWTIAVTDANGSPASDAVITWACDWRPTQQFGSMPRSVTALGAGRFTIAKQNTAVYGAWQLQLWVTNDPDARPFAPLPGDKNDCYAPDRPAAKPNIALDVCLLRDAPKAEMAP